MAEKGQKKDKPRYAVIKSFEKDFKKEYLDSLGDSLESLLYKAKKMKNVV